MELPELPRRRLDPFGGEVSEPETVDPDDRIAQARSFLRWRWPAELENGWLTLCSRPSAGSRLVVEGAYPIEEGGLDELARKAVQLSETADTWVLLNGLGGHPPAGRKGGEVGLRYLVGLHEDLDKGRDVAGWLEFLDQLGELRPSYVVESGGGVHAYWLFEDVVDLAELAEDDVERLHQTRGRFRTLACRFHAWLEREAGCAFDDCTNLDRIMRLPGTLNHKRTGTAPVSVARSFTGRRFTPRALWQHLDAAGVPEDVGNAGESRGLSPGELAEAYARQGTLPEGEAAELIERLLPAYVHRANTYANASRSRNRALFDLAQQLNDHGVSRELAVDALLEARELVTDYTEAGELDPLTVEEVMGTVASAYRYPPRGRAVHPSVVEQAGDGPNDPENDAEGPSTPDEGADPPPGASPRARDTDLANAEEIARRLSGELRYVPGLGWHRWTGTVWADDTAAKLRYARVQSTVARAFLELAEDDTLDVEERRAWARRLSRLESRPGITGAFFFAESLEELQTPIGELDRDPWLLNCPNGTIDLRTGTMREHRPEDLITRCAAVEFRAEAQHELWERVLTRLPDGEKDSVFLRRWFGSALTGVTSEKAILVVLGDHNTGKSTISEAVRTALGDADLGGYATSWEAGVIEMDGRQESTQQAMARARGCRLVTASELTAGRRLNSGFLKSATGGDTVSARRLYQEAVSFRPELKLVMHTNHVPATRDVALQERLRLLAFRNTIPEAERDPSVKDRLTERPENGGDLEVQEAVLAWAVRGAAEWYANGKVAGKPSTHERELEQYARDSDPVWRFVQEHYIIESGLPVEECAIQEQVEMSYRTWCANEEQIRPMGRNKFLAALRERGIYDQRWHKAPGVYVKVLRDLRLRPGGERNKFGLRALDGGASESL